MREINEEAFGNFVVERHTATALAMWHVEAAMGLASEAGEVAQVVRKAMFEGKPLQMGELAIELCDCLHYVQMMATGVVGCSLSDLEELNRAKCEARDMGEGEMFETYIRSWRPTERTLVEEADDAMHALRSF